MCYSITSYDSQWCRKSGLFDRRTAPHHLTGKNQINVSTTIKKYNQTKIYKWRSFHIAHEMVCVFWNIKYTLGQNAHSIAPIHDSRHAVFQIVFSGLEKSRYLR